MIIEINSTTKSKKGTIWMMVKLVEGEIPKTGDKFECEPETPVKHPDEEDNDL